MGHTEGHTTFWLPGPHSPGHPFTCLATFPSHYSSKVGAPRGLRLGLCSRWTHSSSASYQFHLPPHSRWKHLPTQHSTQMTHRHLNHQGQNSSNIPKSAPPYKEKQSFLPRDPWYPFWTLSPTTEQLPITSPVAPIAAVSLNSSFCSSPRPPSAKLNPRCVLLPCPLISVTLFLHPPTSGRAWHRGRCLPVMSYITAHFCERGTLF